MQMCPQQFILTQQGFVMRPTRHRLSETWSRLRFQSESIVAMVSLGLNLVLCVICFTAEMVGEILRDMVSKSR